MKMFVVALTLTFAAAVVAQQPRTQPYPPQQQSSPNQQLPPGQQMPGNATDPSNAAQVEQQIQQGWQAQSDLSTAKLNVQVGGGSVTLTGTVSSAEQHQKAVQVATQNSNGMNVIDKIKVQPQ
jgi:osmotically-inducible protein OsmY